MKIIGIKVSDGSNYWSVQRTKFVVTKLDPKEMENCTHKIPGFNDRLPPLLPCLETHCCSEGVAGGFFKRVQRGTMMGHVIEDIALKVQTLAGIETGFGRTSDSGRKGLYNVVYACAKLKRGRYAGEAALRIGKCLNYAHNTHGLQSATGLVRSLPASERLGVIAGVADRHDKDFIVLGRETAGIFDRIIIRQDSDLRGCVPGVLNGLLFQGVHEAADLTPISIIADEQQAVDAVLEQAHPGMVTVFFADGTDGVVRRLKAVTAPYVPPTLLPNKPLQPINLAA